MPAMDILDRRAGQVALAASVAWCLQGCISVVLPEPTSLLDVTMIVPMVLAMFGVWRLHALGATGTGRLAKVAPAVFAVAIVTAVPGQIAMAFEIDALMWLAFPTSALTFVIGLILTGIAILRARVMPRWVGGVLIAAQPLALAFGLALSPISPLVDSGDYTGALGHGLVWLAIGAAFFGKRIPVPGFTFRHRTAPG